MKLGDLLQELRENILHDRSDQIAGNASDQLWSDATLVRYINESQKRFARRGLVIRDGTTPDVTQVALTAGQNIYPLHPSILGVVSAKQAGDPGDLTRSGHNGFDTWRAPDTTFFDPNSLAQLPPGKPMAFGTDEQLSSDDDGRFSVVNLRLYPAPDAANASNNILLRVVRMPIDDLAVDDMEAEPEIPDLHHMEMLDWAAYLALRMVDVDAEASDRSEKFRVSFEGHVAEARQAVLRKMFVPQQWGFGRNGWSWSN